MMNHGSRNNVQPAPRRGLWWDELAVGQSWRTGGWTVTEDAVIRFAAEWDSQPFHLDAEAARGSVFGTLVGSGLQTLMLSYRLYHATGLLDGTALAGLGIDEVRFHAPLRPGDTIHVLVSVAELAATSRADRGVVALRFETRGADGRTIMTLLLKALVARQGTAAADQPDMPARTSSSDGKA